MSFFRGVLSFFYRAFPGTGKAKKLAAWANYKGTGVLDKITDLSAAEFANDLDFINS